MKKNSESRESKLKVLQIFLLLFLVHIFIVQPIINVFYPSLAERMLKVQGLEENEEEEESSANRIFEEEILHSIRLFYYFDRSVFYAENARLTPYINKLYAWTLADVNTPPPEV